MALGLLSVRSLRRTSIIPALDTVRERSPPLTTTSSSNNSAPEEPNNTDYASATTSSTASQTQGRRPALPLSMRHCDEKEAVDAAISTLDLDVSAPCTVHRTRGEAMGK